MINNELLLADLYSKHNFSLIEDNYLRLYDISNIETTNDKLNLVFAYWHWSLNTLFYLMNCKMETNDPYNANESRELLDLINEIVDSNKNLAESEYSFSINNNYLNTIEELSKFLSKYNGSEIPNTFQQIYLIKYEKIFLTKEITNVQPLNIRIQSEKIIGEGSYAIVYSFIDSLLNTKFCIKKFKTKDSLENDYLRFKEEFSIMKNLNSPYFVQVYNFFDNSKSYIMEFCDYTLEKYIESRNDKLSFNERKKIGLQFLNALKYLYSKNLLHRDLSYRNILIKDYENFVIVKISDFGLVKVIDRCITSSNSSIKGSFQDPTLEKFSDYTFKNELYSIGYILVFIMTGKKTINNIPTNSREIFNKCTNNDLNNRYASIEPLIRDFKNLND